MLAYSPSRPDGRLY